MNISEMTPKQLLTAALNHPIARNFIGMAALQLEGVGSINPKAVRDGVMKVAATLANSEATPESSRLASAYQDERDRESLPHAHRNLNLPTFDEDDAALADHQLNTTMCGRQIEASQEAGTDRMAMIEFD